MEKFTFKDFLIATLFLVIIACGTKGADPKIEMENSYKEFLKAINAKDETALKNTMSAVAYMKMKNAMTSAKMEFPKTLFESASDFELNNAKLDFIKVLEKGCCGEIIYYDPKEEHAVILKFLKENEGWKFSGIEMYGTEELTKKAKAKDFSFLEDEKFKLDSIAPKIEKEIAPVDYVAMLDRSGEYKISIWVNDIKQDVTDGGSKSGILIGGVKKGKNTIEIKLESLAVEKGGSISVTVRALIGNTQSEVFTLTEETPPPKIIEEFTVQ